MTKIIKMNSFDFEENELKEASKILKNNGTVVFPTETVYGLGANGLNEIAIKKIYNAKGRPSDNPLILHINKLEKMSEICYIDYSLLKKIKILTPGPITFVLNKKDIVPDAATGGRKTVAIRIPVHPIANKLLKMTDLPIAAPSANLSGKPSPTRPEHVIEDMNNRVDMIITAEELKYGIESTVLDLSNDVPTILRPGPIPPEKLEEIFGSIKIPDFVFGKVKADIALAPGMKYKHYSPDIPVILIEEKNNIEDEKKIILDEYKKRSNSIVLGYEELEEFYKKNNLNYEIISKRFEYYKISVKLFYLLRKYDKISENIIISGIKDKGIGIGIMNRIRKASTIIR